MSRPSVPQRISNQVLFQNRPRCCVCHEPRKPVHIHHIDNNPANNRPNNLAVLCLDHHSDVTGAQGLGHNYTVGEIRLYKEAWEAECTTWRSISDSETEPDTDDTIEPIEMFSKTVVLAAEDHESWRFNLDEGDKIAFSMTSDEPIDFMILTQRQYKRWANEGEGATHEHHENITSLDDSFEIPKDGWWAIVFWNGSEESAEVQFAVSTWPSE